MEELIARVVGNLHDRIGGPMSLRLLLQPTMAAFFAVRAGVRDARAGRPAYLWAVATDPRHRRYLVREGWQAIAKVFVMAIVIDAIYQVTQLRWFYPLEALIVAFTLACVPYALLRGPVARIAKSFRPRVRTETT
jgi:hypothetical protein